MEMVLNYDCGKVSPWGGSLLKGQKRRNDSCEWETVEDVNLRF